MRTTSTWKGGSKPKRGAKSRRIAQPKNPILIIFKRKEIRSLTSVVAGTFQQRDKSRTKHEVTAFADCAMGIHLEYKLGKNLSPRVVSFPGGLTKNDVYAAVSEKYKKLQVGLIHQAVERPLIETGFCQCLHGWSDFQDREALRSE